MDFESMTKKELVEVARDMYNLELEVDSYSKRELVAKLKEAEAETEAKIQAEDEVKTAKKKPKYPKRINKNIIQTGKTGMSTG